jgi:hypothetical protein
MVTCTAVSCVRQMSGKKSYINYMVEETCENAKKGICTYKRNPKVERNQDGKPVPGNS